MLSKKQIEYYQALQERQRERARTIGEKGYNERRHALSQLKKMLLENEERWLNALQADLGKHPVEAYASELAVLLNELETFEKNLADWMKPSRQKRFLLTGKEDAKVSRHPYGSILVLSPWNYPLQLSLMPVIGALAAGNSCFLKPSEYAAATSQLLAELVPHYFPADVLQVVEGDSHVAQALTALQWDFVFFTGSQQVGKKVYLAAAEHLTPVLLELGGKNPCILDDTGLTDDAIEQIAWGKFLNAGQSCIAPDTVYVPRKLYGEFLGRMKVQIQRFYGSDSRNSPSYGRISHVGHFDKLVDLLSDGSVYYGGQREKEERFFFSPTLLVDIKEGSRISQEEIFGPILPVIPYDSLEEVIASLHQLPTPLVVYLFSSNPDTLKQVENTLESGALSLNEVITYAANSHLPFGGKGRSGMGRYHGLASFEAFTYQRTSYTKRPRIPLRQQYPPYSKQGLNGLRRLRKRIF